jgi:hypothetical protein
MALSPAIQTVIENGNDLFTKKVTLLSHWQDLADFFYYERADFTTSMSLGTDFASHSMVSDGALCRREMGNLYRAMLRPSDFFEIKSLDDKLNKDGEARDWLEYATKLQRAVMYRKDSGFTRALDAGDHDHVTFGQCVVEVNAGRDRRSVYYRNWHLRDCAWSESYSGQVEDFHRNCDSSIRMLTQLFGDKVPETLRKDGEKDPFKTVKARHVVVPVGNYDLGYSPRAGQTHASVWVLPDHGAVLENVARSYRGYVVPRAATVSGSQYATSPFTSIILPDARMHNEIARILLEAGEKAVDPPMIARTEVVRSDIGLYAGGITWIDDTFDERTGEAIRPLAQDFSGLPFGQDLADRTSSVIRQGFMLDKVRIPELGNKTAYEVRKIVEQQMRAQLPIFEPVEKEYNEPLCAETFAVMRSLGAFPANEIPEVLQRAEVDYTFKSPIKDLEDDGMRQKMLEGMEVINAAAQIDPRVAKLPDAMALTKDMLRRSGWPEDWIRNEKNLEAALQEAAQQAQADEIGATAMNAAEGAGKAAPMVKALMEGRKAA